MNYVKVKHPALKKAVYLENPKTITKAGHTFISGHVANKYGDPKMVKGGVVLHLLEVGEDVDVGDTVRKANGSHVYNSLNF